MSKIFLLETNERIKEILTKNLESEFCLKTICFSDPDKLISEVNNDDVKIIITRNWLETEEGKIHVSSKVFNFSYDLDKKIPIIILGDDDHISDFVHYLPERFRIEEFNRLVIKVMKFSAEQLSFFKLPEYVPISISNFYLMESSNSDVYIKIRKKSGDQYIKRFFANDNIGKDLLKKYEEKKVEELFIKKEDHIEMMNLILSQSINKLNNIKTSNEDAVSMANDAFDLTNNLILTMGLNKHSIKMADATIESLKKNIVESDDSIEMFLKKLFSNPSSLSFRRSYFIILLSHHVIPLLDWGRIENQKQVFDQVSFVSFFHDFYLTKEDLQKITSKEELQSSNLSESDKKLVNEHANLASTLIQSYPHAPSGSDIIIRQHHGTLNGIGFTSKLSSGISPVAILFIVLEKVANEVFSSCYNNLAYYDLLTVSISNVEEYFELPSFRKILQTLKTSIQICQKN